MPKVTVEHEQARRQQIISAAATCFSRQGFAATSIPDIVAESGLSVGSIYRYYPSKEDLFLAVILDRVVVYHEAVYSALMAPGSALERLRASLGTLGELLSSQAPEDARLSLELWARARDVEQLADWLREARSRRLKALADVIHDGRAKRELRHDLDPSDAAACLLALADGLVVERACAPLVSWPGRAVRSIEQLLRAWKANSAEAE